MRFSTMGPYCEQTFAFFKIYLGKSLFTAWPHWLICIKHVAHHFLFYFSIVALARSVILGYEIFRLSNSACAHKINFNILTILGLGYSWCSCFNIAAFNSLAIFWRCVWSSKSENGEFCGFSKANSAKVRSSSLSTSGLLSPASEIWVCANVRAPSL